MIIGSTAHTVTIGQGRTVDLGVTRMRVLAHGDPAVRAAIAARYDSIPV